MNSMEKSYSTSLKKIHKLLLITCTDFRGYFLPITDFWPKLYWLQIFCQILLISDFWTYILLTGDGWI